METEIERYPNGGGKIICKVKRTANCAHCSRPHTKLCDFVMNDGKTCDEKLCWQHAHQQGGGKDYCPIHASIVRDQRREIAATDSQPTEPTRPAISRSLNRGC